MILGKTPKTLLLHIGPEDDIRRREFGEKNDCRLSGTLHFSSVHVATAVT